MSRGSSDGNERGGMTVRPGGIAMAFKTARNHDLHDFSYRFLRFLSLI